MDQIGIKRDPDAAYECRPKNAPPCGARVPIARTTCPRCRQPQRRPVAPPAAAGAPLLADCTLFDADSGRPLLLASSVSREAAGFVAAMAQEWTYESRGRPRLSGLGDRQAMFGTIQPQPLRRRYGCRRSVVARGTDPARWQAVADECHGILAKHLPTIAERNVAAAAGIADVWKWAGTGWTSGVLNHTQLLPYHRDAGNLAHSWSAMIGARSKTTGGHLYLPEYGVWIDVGHRSLVCFPGGDVTHGVTPMTVARTGWRVTAVFYGLKACASCASSEQAEIERAARRGTERAREVARARRR